MAGTNPLGAYQELSLEAGAVHVFLESIIIELGGLPQARELVDQAVSIRDNFRAARDRAREKAFGRPDRETK